MDIPLFVSGRDRMLSSNYYGVRYTVARERPNASPECAESHSISDNIRDNEVGRSAAARGAFVGVLLGVSLWVGILIFAGIIKL